MVAVLLLALGAWLGFSILYAVAGFIEGFKDGYAKARRKAEAGGIPQRDPSLRFPPLPRPTPNPPQRTRCSSRRRRGAPH